MSDPVITGAARLASGPFADMYKAAKGKVAKTIGAKALERLSETAAEKIGAIAFVKTIWKYDEAVHLNTFFFPPQISASGKSMTIESIEKFKGSKKFVLRGTAGQGKSILLRHLCLEELTEGVRIPVFYELRKLEAGTELRQSIEKKMERWGIADGAFAFDFLADRGNLTLLLDGFDELSHGAIEDAIRSIDALLEKYPKLHLVVSSRPDTGIMHVNALPVYELCPLDESDVPLVAEKITGQPEYSDLIREVLRERPYVVPIFKTPLSVALLIFVYQADVDIPNSLSEFYAELFPLLFERHDKSKPAFKRERNCDLSKREMQTCFDTVCFCMQEAQVLEAKDTKFAVLVRDALQELKFEVDPDDYIKDIIEITCLLIRDGGTISALHRSVVEFHCAQFISNLPDEEAAEFYDNLLRSSSWQYWMQVVNFLANIDPVRVRTMYLIPESKRALNGISTSAVEETVSERLVSEFNRALEDHAVPPSRIIHNILSSGPSEDIIFRELVQTLPKIISEPRFSTLNLAQVERYYDRGVRDQVRGAADEVRATLRKDLDFVADDLERSQGRARLLSRMSN